MKKQISEKTDYPLYLSPEEVISQGFILTGPALELFALKVFELHADSINKIYSDAIDRAQDEVDQMELF